MWRHPCVRHRPTGNEDGYTFVEVIVAIAVILVTTGGIFAVLYGSYIFLGKIMYNLETNQRVLIIDNVFRSTLLRVRPPFWNRELLAQVDNSYFRIAYIDGQPGYFLEGRISNNFLILSTSEGDRSFPLNGDAVFKGIEGSFGLSGVMLILMIGSQEVQILGYFGASGIGL